MKVVKQTTEHTIVQRRDGRYAVRGRDKNWINGDAKVEILVAEGLLTKQTPKAEPEAAEEASGDDAGGDVETET